MGNLARWEFLVGLFYDFPYFDVYLVGRPFDTLSAFLCGVLRCLSGAFVATGVADCARPQKLLKLYEFEACPYCRKAREALCVLDLDFEVRPCPKPALRGKFGVADDSSRFRSEVAASSGKTSFPVLVDGEVVIRGSEEIVAHVWKNYGQQATPPLSYRAGRLLDRFFPLFLLPSLLRLRSPGVLKLPSRAPQEPLVLWGFEPSPFVKLVREALCSLELPYVYRAVPHGSAAKRAEFKRANEGFMSQGSFRRSLGLIQVPMLQDPNHGGAPIFESLDIVRYLYKTYGELAAKSQ